MKKGKIALFSVLFILSLIIVSAVISSLGGMKGKVAVVNVTGPIVEAKTVVDEIKAYARDASIKAIVLRVDSPGGGVTAIFAGAHTIADRILMERIRELKKPGEWIAVSSDREVQQAAARRRLIVWSSPDFIARLTPPPQSRPDAPPPVEDEVSQADVAEWLSICGDVPQDPLPARPTAP